MFYMWDRLEGTLEVFLGVENFGYISGSTRKSWIASQAAQHTSATQTLVSVSGGVHELA
jgi:hypothetical protein